MFRHLSLVDGVFQKKRQEQSVAWVWTMVEELFHSKLKHHEHVEKKLPGIMESVRNGTTTPSIAATQIWENFEKSLSKDAERENL